MMLSPADTLRSITEPSSVVRRAINSNFAFPILLICYITDNGLLGMILFKSHFFNRTVRKKMDFGVKIWK